MESFKELFERQEKQRELLMEKTITFNKRLPNYNNVVILGGGGGSGKGFIGSRILGIQGKVFDVDQIKEYALESIFIKKKIKDKLGIDISDLNLKNPEHTGILHKAIDELGLPKAKMDAFKKVIDVDSQHKPNLIFDVTLKDMPKFFGICNNAEQMGYNKENIHIVWVLNKLSIARKNNIERSRTVPEDVIISTHHQVQMTLFEIVDYLTQTSKQAMDGDIWITFTADGDIEIDKSESGGSYIKNANYVKIKEAGKPIKPLTDLADDIMYKIQNYVHL